MARRPRKTRNRGAETGVPASPCIRRALPFFDPLDAEQLDRLEKQVDWIIQDVGIVFRGDPEALRIWAAGESENVEIREKAGSNCMRTGAYERWNVMLDRHQPLATEVSKKEKRDAFVARRKRELPDAWY